MEGWTKLGAPLEDRVSQVAGVRRLMKGRGQPRPRQPHWLLPTHSLPDTED